MYQNPRTENKHRFQTHSQKKTNSLLTHDSQKSIHVFFCELVKQQPALTDSALEHPWKLWKTTGIKTPCALCVISLTCVCSWCQGLFWITSEGAIKFQMWNKAGWKLFPYCCFDSLLAVFPTVSRRVALSWQGRLLFPLLLLLLLLLFTQLAINERAPLPGVWFLLVKMALFLATVAGFGGSGSWL